MDMKEKQIVGTEMTKETASFCDLERYVILSFRGSIIGMDMKVIQIGRNEISRWQKYFSVILCRSKSPIYKLDLKFYKQEIVCLVENAYSNCCYRVYKISIV